MSSNTRTDKNESSRRVVAFTAGKALVGAVMAMMFVAGVAKLLDLESFRRSLFTWDLLPDRLLNVSWIGLPAAEAVLPVTWAFGLRPRLMERAMLGLLASMLAVVTLHWMRGSTPTCHCLGVLARHLDFLSEARFMLAKAAGMFGLLFAGHLLLFLQEVRGGRPTSPPRAMAMNRRPAFTLIELLVVIAIVSVLVGLVIVGLAGARKYGRQAKTLALLQQHGGVLSAYASDWQDYFPIYVDAANPPYAFDVMGETMETPIYFAAPNLWFWALRDRYYEGQPIEIFSDASDTGVVHQGGRGFFDMPCTLFAVPEFWAPETRLAGISQLRGVLHADVTFPSQKATLVSQFPIFRHASTQGDLLPDPLTLTVAIPVLAADGHAGARSSRQFIPGVQMADTVFNTPGITMHSRDLLVGLHTYKGVRGMDWK